MKLFISSNSSLSADKAEMIRFISEICQEYNAPLLEVMEGNNANIDELTHLVAECDIFIALTDTSIENRVMKEFNAATICNMRGTTPVIYVYNKEPEDGATEGLNFDKFTSYLIDEAKRIWNRYPSTDFLRILLALQLEAFNPRIFKTRLIGNKIYLRNLEVGDMLQSPAVLFSSSYDNMQAYLAQIKRDDITPNEAFQNAVIARSARQKSHDLLEAYYDIYRQMATLPSRAAASQLRVGYNNIYNGNTANALKVLNIEELTATVNDIEERVKNGEQLNRYQRIELKGAIEAMGLRALTLMTDIYNQEYLDQAADALRKTILLSQDGKTSVITYVQHLTAYAHFMNKYKGNPDGAKWYEIALEILLHSEVKNSAEGSIEVGKAYLNIANYYIDVKNDEKAMWALKEALSIYSTLSPHDPTMGLIYWGFAKVHSHRGEYLEALTCCTTGEKLYLMTHAEGDLSSIKFWFMQINLRRETSQPDFSEEEYLSKEQMMLSYYGQDEPLIEFYLFLSDMYASKKEYSKAIDILQKALVISDDKLGELCCTSLTLLSRMAVAGKLGGNKQHALEYAEELMRRLRLTPESTQDMKMAADTFFLMGEVKDSLEDFNGAVQDFYDAAKIYHSVTGKLSEEKALCYKHIGDIFYKCKQFDTAAEYLLSMLNFTISKYGEDSLEAVNYYQRIADAYYFAYDNTSALEFYQKITKLDPGTDEGLEPDLYNAIICAYIGIGGCQVAIEEYSAAVETYERLIARVGRLETAIFSDVYLKFAIAQKECGDDVGALNHYHDALTLKSHYYGEDTKYTGPIHIELAQLYEKHEVYSKALTHYTKGLSILIEVMGEDNETAMMNYYRVARVQIQNENYQEALEAAMRSKEIYEKIGHDDKREYAMIYGYISDAIIKMAQSPEEMELSFNYKKTSLEMYEQLGDNISVCFARRDMGLIYERMGDLQKALECFKAELDFYEGNVDPNQKCVGNVYENIARILFATKNDEMQELAIKYQIKAIDIFEKNDDTIDSLRSLYCLANTYNALEDPEKEVEPLEKMITIMQASEEYKADEMYAEILQQLSVAYRKTYAYGDSEKCIKEALEFFKERLGEETQKTVFAYYDLSLLYYDGERYDEAVDIGEITLSLTKKLFAADSLEVFNAMCQLEKSYSAFGAHDQAIKMVLERVDLVEKMERRTDMDLVVVYSNANLIFKAKGDYSSQIKWLGKMIALEQTMEGAESKSMANSLFCLGEALHKWGIECDDYKILANAKEILLRSIALYEKCESEEQYNSTDIDEWATAYADLAYINMALSRYDEALLYVEKAENRFKINSDINDQMLCYNLYAMIYNDLKLFDKAVEYYNKALDQLDEDDINRYAIYRNIALCYQDCCQFEEALHYMTKAYDVTFGLFDDDDYHRADIYASLGDSYIDIGNYERSKECIGEALYIYEQKGEDTILFAKQLASMGYVTLINKEYDKAIDYTKRALDIRLKLVGEQSLLVASSYSNLGRCYTQTGRFDEARELLFKSLELRKALCKAEVALEVAISLFAIGELLTYSGKYSEAEEYLLKSIDYYTQIYDNQHIYVARSLHSLGIAYKLSGDTAKGIETLNTALAIRSRLLRENHPDLVATREALL